MPSPKTSRPDPSNKGDIHPTNRSRDQLAVDRAIAELRRGGVVALRAGAERDRIALVTAAEMATDGTLARLAALAGSEPSLAITAHRAAGLGLQASAEVLGLGLSQETPLDRILALADPTQEREAPENGTPENDTGDALAGLSVLPEKAEDPAATGIRLAKLARLLPSVLVATVPTVRPAELEAWAFERSLLTVDRDVIDSHDPKTAARLVRAADARVPLVESEETRLIAFRPLDGGTEHVAIRIGDPDTTQPVLVRLHSQCLTGDLLGSLRCDCGDQLRGSIAAIAEAGGGILLYLAQEGRGIGLINKLKAYALQDLGADTVDANTQLGFDDDERVYFEAAEMLRQLGVSKVRLMTNNPNKVQALAACGVEVVERIRHVFPTNRHNAGYLKTKADRSGHMI